MTLNHEADAQLTEKRLALTAIEQKIQNFITTPYKVGKAHATLALRAAQLAAMWLGKAKGALGIQSPYPASYDASSKVIESRADYQELPTDERLEFDAVAEIKGFRAELKKIEKTISSDMKIFKQNDEYQFAVQTAYVRCSEATMWLGMVLNDIKLAQDAEAAGPVEPQAESGSTGDVPPAEEKKSTGIVDTVKGLFNTTSK